MMQSRKLDATRVGSHPPLVEDDGRLVPMTEIAEEVKETIKVVEDNTRKSTEVLNGVAPARRRSLGDIGRV